METVKGYRFLDTVVHEGKNTVIRKGIRVEDETSVIVKLLKEQYPRPQQLAKFRQEYEIGSSLKSAGVVKALALETYGNGLALILEDFGGVALRGAFPDGKPTIHEFLRIAISVAEILGEIHSSSVIHKDIKPQNILYNAETKEVRIIDFGISAVVQSESQGAVAVSNLEGSLPYISPEQTGRMNRRVDYRTDFYSLGVSLYELLAGELPFKAREPMEMLHCHIAVQPRSPHEVVPAVPLMLSEIVMKLMAKNAEDRYQSAFGLKHDLEECRRQFEATGSIEHFKLGAQDLSERFQIPQKLYGRDKEVQTLIKAFARASLGESELMMVAGYSGIGKSALVNEVQKPLVEARGYFIAGKFDQFKRNIPYSALIQAIQGFVREILSESNESIEKWKKELLTALGANGQVIVDVVPEVEFIIGKQPPVPQLGPAESQNRMLFVFQSFIQVLAQKDHPLAIFLDDLQWADSGTLRIIQNLMLDKESKHLFVIGAYRENEVDRHHAMMVMLTELKTAGLGVRNLKLGPLAHEHVAELIAETFHVDERTAGPIAELAIAKTNGNPFFLTEMLRTLVESKKIFFDSSSGGWRWEIEDLRGMELSSNVVELMADKIQRLPEEVRAVMSLGSCIGNVFDMLTLKVVTGESVEVLSERTMKAIQEGMLSTVGDGYRLLGNENLSDEQLADVRYAFVHDRVQAAANGLLDEKEKTNIHHKIGRMLLEVTPEAEVEEHIFDIVSQLNAGRELITDDAEKLRLGELNLVAGKRAKASSAFSAALDHFQIAADSAGDGIWQQRYEFAFELYRELSQTEYIAGNTERAEQLFTLIIERANTKLEKAQIYKIQQILLFDQNKYRESILVGLEGLRMFGVKLPEKPSQVAILTELASIYINLRGRKIQSLVDAAELQDEEKYAVMGMIQELLPCGYLTNPDLLVLGALRMANISLRFGASARSAYAFGVTGLVINGALFLYKIGNEFNELSLKLLDRFADHPDTGPSIGPTHMLSSSFTTWPTNKINGDIIEERRKTAIHKSIDFGVFNYTTYTITLSWASRFLRGDSIDEIFDYLKQYEKFIAGAKDDDAEKLYVLELQFLNNLRGKAGGKYSMSDLEGKFNADDYIREAKARGYNSGVFFFYTLSSFINYTYEDYEGAFKTGIEASKKWDGALSNAALTIQAFYLGLSAITLLNESKGGSRSAYRKAFKKNKAHIKKKWVSVNPDNFNHLLWMLEAEEARLNKNDVKAMDFYEKAIQHCREHGYTNYLALANELAARYYIAAGKERIGRSYMAEAHYTYMIWGASAKVKDLEEKYGDMLARSGPGGSGTTTQAFLTTTGGQTTMDTMTTHGSEGGGSNQLDLNTVMKASQTISGEIKLERLLSQLMQIVIENAGAERGFMLMENHGALAIQAEGDVSKGEYRVEEGGGIPVNGSGRLPESVVNYVARVREDVVLNDAANEGNFTNDDFIQAKTVKSLLCSPIVNQGKLVGVVYLENNLATGAFTPARLKVLKLLSTQAAISLENASLYSNLEEKVEERTAELRESKKEIDDIMSNVSQGLMTINPSMIISSEYSAKVAQIFERDDLGGVSFTQLFQGVEGLPEKLSDYLEQMFTNPFMSMKLFDRANPLLEYHYTVVNRLQEEVEKILDFGFSRIYGTDEEGKRTNTIEKIMVVVDDRTEEYQLKKELEQKAEEQANRVEKLYQILQLQPSVFSNFINEARETLDITYQSLGKLADNPAENKKLLQLCFREVHTLKGNARALNLDSIGKTAHELENVFDELREQPEGITEELKEKVFTAVRALKDDVADGNSLFDKILNMQQALQTKSKDVMQEFEERFRTIVDREAEALGKNIEFKFNNNLERALDGQVMIKLRNPISHIIRNSLSHGIEEAGTRKESGKSEMGTISLSLDSKEGFLHVTCEDDGAGLQTEKIRQKAVAMKLVTAEQAPSLSESEIHKLIFQSGLSTADAVSDIAGRGVGMDAVKEDLKSLGAVVMVASKPKLYTRFTIRIPEKAAS